MKLTTTLRLLRGYNACKDRYVHLVAALSEWGDDKPIPLLRILRENGMADTFWAFRAVPEEQATARDRLARLFAADCAVRVLHLFEAKHPTDMRPRVCILVARRFANGKATQEELDAAWAAARAAADAAWDVAAAAAAARDAAWDAEHKWQSARLGVYLRSPTVPRPIPLPRRAK
mgnify:CR=1 FL=1